MSKAMTRELFEARYAMYDEAADHLELAVAETAEECYQSKIVANQIRKLRDRFYERFWRKEWQ